MSKRLRSIARVAVLLGAAALCGCHGKGADTTVPRNSISVTEAPPNVKKEGGGAVADTAAIPAPPGVQTGNYAGGRR